MSGNIKMLLVILALGALFSVWYGSSFFKATPAAILPATASILDGATGDACNRDTDHDGIDDCQEKFWSTDPYKADTDGDGFLDGEEVLTGHNPIVKGPNDFIDTTKNLTQRASSLVIGGILTGDLQPGSSSYDASLQKLSDSILQSYQHNTTIVVDPVTLTPTDTLADQRTYVGKIATMITTVLIPTLNDAQGLITSIGNVPWNNPSVLTSDPARMAKLVTAAQTLAQTTAARAAKVIAIPVPQSFANQHTAIIKLMRTLQRRYELTAQIKNDPVQGIAAIYGISTIITQSFPIFFSDLATTIQHQLP